MGGVMLLTEENATSSAMSPGTAKLDAKAPTTRGRECWFIEA